MSSSEASDDSGNSQPRSDDEEDQTPLERHIQLEVAQIVYESMLQSRPIPTTVQSSSKWRKKYLGKDWARANEELRLLESARTEGSGEGDTVFQQAAAASRELQLEVLWTGQHASELEDVDRARVRRALSKLASLARRSEDGCRGACAGRGLEALVATMQVFARARDEEGAEALRLCAKCLQQVLRVGPCLEALAGLDAPRVPGLPAQETGRGWPFLHAAFAAYVEQERAVAFELAKCLSYAAASPGLLREVTMLRTPTEEEVAHEPEALRSLRALVRRAHEVTKRFIIEEGKPFPELVSLRDVFESGVE